MSIQIGSQALPDNPGERALFVQAQFIDLFLKQNNRAQSAILLCSFGIFLLLRLRLHSLWPYIWILAVVVVSVIRFFFANRWIESVKHPIAAIVGLMSVNSVLIVIPVVGFPVFADIDRAFISVILISFATASVAATNGYRGIYLWFAAPLLVALGFGWAVYVDSVDESQWVRWGIAGLTGLYLIYLMKLGSDQNRVFAESCRIRFAERSINSRLTTALEEAKLATLAKSRFLAAASHDLRQPLHTIGVLLAALGLRNLDDRSREIVQMLSNVSKSLSGQLDGLLDISKLDAGVMVTDLRPHRLDQVVKAHVAQIEHIGQEKSLYVRSHCPQAVVVMTDMHLVQRVLSNLTGNALKFTRQGGVDVSLQQLNGKAVLEIADSGIGIAQEHQQLVFQEFYQVGNDERDRAVGLGLGLAIAQRICALLGIDIQLVSSPGQGTRFILTMPCIENDSMHSAPVPLLEPMNFQQRCVLLVDDERDVRLGMRLLLEELGCKVVLAESVAQAVLCAREHRLAMVISDLRLRNMETGFDAIAQVRAVQPTVYPLLISGDTGSDRLQQAHASGIAFLHKPVAVETLIKHLQNVGSLT